MGVRSLLIRIVDSFQSLAGPSGVFEAAQRFRVQRRYYDAVECYAKAARMYA